MLDYEPEPPPTGFETWTDYWRSVGVPEDELDSDRDNCDSIVDPTGVGPRVWFQIVPEGKTVKNRVHLDVAVSGGREVPIEIRRDRVDSKWQQLLAAGGTTLRGAQRGGRRTLRRDDARSRRQRVLPQLIPPPSRRSRAGVTMAVYGPNPRRCHNRGREGTQAGPGRRRPRGRQAQGVGGRRAREWLASLRMSQQQMGVRRTALTLLRVNQDKGFDCPGCAWPDGDAPRRHVAEFCENGAKAVAEEATLRRVTPEFFAEHSVDDLATRYRLLARAAGPADPADVEAAGLSALRAGHLGAGLRASSPTSCARSTTRTRRPSTPPAARPTRRPSSTSCFVRRLGTNNLPDCSNMCHESSGSALNETIGIGKGIGAARRHRRRRPDHRRRPEPGHQPPAHAQRPGDRPRSNGARIIAVNPLPEAGLMRFKNPQKARGVIGRGTALADQYARIRVAGDQAFFQALGALVLEAEAARARHRAGPRLHRAPHHRLRRLSQAPRRSSTGATWPTATGLTAQPRSSRSPGPIWRSDRVIVCWAMGLTQHKKAVPTIQEIVNLLLLRGNIGKPGAGVCPVRGHSNVQGDRTMGIYERMPDAFLDRLGDAFGFEPPREHGYDTVAAIGAMRDGVRRVFFAMGGNFVAATPDTDVTEAGDARRSS